MAGKGSGRRRGENLSAFRNNYDLWQENKRKEREAKEKEAAHKAGFEAVKETNPLTTG
jgi:hypothetical protein